MNCAAGDDGRHYVTIDPDAIERELVSSRGKNRGRFRRSRPKLVEDGGVYGAAYVWRMIQFHCGLDMTMPVMAPMYIGCGFAIDDYDRAVMGALDDLADRLGAQWFGQAATYRAAIRWGVAMHGSDTPVSEQARATPRHQRTGEEVTFGDVASALGVRDAGDGLDLGGPDVSPEHYLETDLLDRDGKVTDEDALSAPFETPPGDANTPPGAY